MGKSLKVEKRAFDAALHKLIAAKPTPLAKIKGKPTKPAKKD